MSRTIPNSEQISASPRSVPAHATQEAEVRTSETHDDDDGFDLGLLRLVGLAGLLGLKRRDPRDARGTTNRV